MTYLGIPFSVTKLPKTTVQPLSIESQIGCQHGRPSHEQKQSPGAHEVDSNDYSNLHSHLPLLTTLGDLSTQQAHEGVRLEGNQCRQGRPLSRGMGTGPKTDGARGLGLARLAVHGRGPMHALALASAH